MLLNKYDYGSSDSFFDIPDMAHPPGARFWFNIRVYTVYFGTEKPLLPKGVEECWIMDHLTDARPYVAFFKRVDDGWLDDPIDIEWTDHCVVEQDPNGSIGWFYMLDFECVETDDYDEEDAWRIKPLPEDFDYDEEDYDE